MDREWQIPHFEKMLYDNGPLVALYAQAHLATGEPLFAKVASESGDWLLADMRSPEGAFYSSRDADSEGEEGRYYVWTRDEVRALLPDDEYDVVARRFGVDGEPNFEGKWHLAAHESPDAIAKALDRPLADVENALDRGKATMLERRSRRVAPARDEKQLASWNALTIRGLAIAGNVLDRSDFVAAAVRAADFIGEHMFRDERLFASFKDGAARFPAYLDDHAFLLDALLELLQADWHSRHLALAVRLADTLLDHFHDPEGGGFWFTADDHEALMHRPKPLADESMPSGNGIAALALQRLGFLLGESRYLEAAEGTLRHASQLMTQHPQAHVTLLTALEEYLDNPETIIIRGDPPVIDRWRVAAQKIYAPRRLIFAIPSDCPALPGALSERAARPGSTVAYRCLGSHCSMPLESLDALAAELRESASDRARN